MRFVHPTRGHTDLRNRGDTRQCLPPKPHGRHRFELIKRTDFTRGVGREGQGQILLGHTTTIIAHLDQARTGFFDTDVDSQGAGIDSVLHQLLDHGRRAFNHFTCGYLVDQFRR